MSHWQTVRDSMWSHLVQLDLAKFKTRSEGQAASFMVHPIRCSPLGSCPVSRPPDKEEELTSKLLEEVVVVDIILEREGLLVGSEVMYKVPELMVGL